MGAIFPDNPIPWDLGPGNPRPDGCQRGIRQGFSFRAMADKAFVLGKYRSLREMPLPGPAKAQLGQPFFVGQTIFWGGQMKISYADMYRFMISVTLIQSLGNDLTPSGSLKFHNMLPFALSDAAECSRVNGICSAKVQDCITG